MSLELDTRQRAMLQEMGVPVWLPESGVAVLERPASSEAASAVSAVAPPQRKPATNVQTAPVAAAPMVAVPVPLATGSPDWSSLLHTVQHCQSCTL